MDVDESNVTKTRTCRKRSFAVFDSNLPQDEADSVLESPSSSGYNHKDFNPRSYQLEVFQVSRRRNTIAFMETGSGKTMIAVMLIRDVGLAVRSSGQKKLFIFLAPTVHLVHQQFEVIKIHTNLEVGEYYGAKGVDEWRAESWEKEINEHAVLVMTPQILLDALRKAFLSLEQVCLMIIDECHHATGNHPYTKIMKEFYHKSKDKPKIFGMTASPVVRKGVSSTMDCEGQISDLESILDSQIYRIEDKKEMEVYVPSARETYIFYEQAESRSLDLKASIEASWFKNEALLSKLYDVVQIHYKDLDDKFKTLRKRFSNGHSTILYCLHELGVVCAYEAVQVCLEGASTAIEECEIYRQSLVLYKNYLEEVLNIIGESYSLGKESVFSFGNDYSVDSRYISPKLFALLQLFKSFGESRQVPCLIFVERIVAARVIEQFVKKVTDLSHFTTSCLTGCNASTRTVPPKMHKETLESFCYGQINLLFATDVVEEGIHIPKCSCVVRFDLPKTVRSYVQSRGRARQDNSNYVIMMERGNMKHRDQLFDLIKSEFSMMDAAMSRDPDTCNLKPCYPEVKNVHVIEASGASITADSSVSLIHLYSAKLPGDKYFTPKPIFQISSVGGSYQCKLSLPPNAPFQTVVGPLCRSSNLSKQLVCLEACKRLHEVGALDDHFLPCIGDSSKFDVIEKIAKVTGAGTKKRKELHGTTQIRALSGSWGENLDGAIFQAYKFSFSCNVAGELFSGFVLLMQSKLDDDVGNIEVELYLVSKIVKASVLSCGEIHMSAEQIIKSKAFQEFFFNGMFGRLFVGSKSTGTRRDFLLQKETRSLWNPYNLYFLLPLEQLNVSDVDSWKIDWTGISSCASIIEFFMKNSSLGMDNFCGVKVNLENSCLAERDCSMSNVICFANCSVAVESVKDMVVLAIHTGRIYSIVEAVSDTSAESTFDGKIDGTTSDYLTFAEYFNKKYGIVLRYPKQPLLRLKQSHNPHNLLVNFNDIGDETLKSGMVSKKPQMHVHMPPELLLKIDFPKGVLKSSYLLPSLMHRLESLMLSSQLRKEIGGHASSFKISSHLILEALTTLRCCESFSMERMELLGDSVLKYAVSCHLFLKYPKKHEGQLSDLRRWVVCNATLHKLGASRNLQGYICDSPFDPRRWCAPGQFRTRHVPCKCEVDTLEVPLECKFQVEDPKVVLGICCDKGHRWMISKTIADCVESLIGAYYIDGGLIAALHVMKWFGIEAELDPTLLFDAIATATMRLYIPKMNDILALESKIGYQFVIKGLLLEAITHGTEQELGLDYCYQRLEFLGDSVLDLLITRHLFLNHEDIDPGEMTDLRSASVNNENFARVAVRHNFQQHLQHCSSLLLSQITEYVTYLAESHGGARTSQGTRGPKVLGDLVESIAGAILIDTKLNLDEVWRIYKPLLSPIVTPDKLELPPLRELNELCDSLGYFINEKCTRKGEMVRAELKLQLNDILLIGEGYERSRKTAKGEAASRLLNELKKRGISFSYGSKKRKNSEDVDGLPFQDMKNDISCKKTNGISPELNGQQQPTAVSSEGESSCIIPAVPINRKKGGPRNSLFQLCKSLNWPMPTFKSTEHKSRTPIEFDEGSEKRIGLISFQSEVILHIPNSGSIECVGDAKADKKSSLDSAALALLNELHSQGKINVVDP